MDDLNSLYQKSLLFDGKFENNKIIHNKYRSISIRLVNTILYIVILSHLIIFLTDQNIFKDHLIYLKFADDYGSRILNFGGGIALTALRIPLTVYKKYSQNLDDFSSLGFLFCFNEEEMNKKYHLSKLRSKRQIKLQFILLNFAKIQRYYYLITFCPFVGKNCYEIVMKTSFDQAYLNYLINSIKIIGSIWFLIAYQIITLALTLLTNECILSFKYLAYRLDDQIDKISKLFLKDQIENKNRLSRQLSKIIKNYNLIIKSRKKINKHFDKSLNHTLVILTFTVILLAIVLNGHNSKFITYFYIADFLICYLYLSIYSYSNYVYLDANNRFWKQFNFLVRYSDSRSSIKILNIYTLNNQLDAFSFNYRKIYNYTWNFLIRAFIESTVFILLLYQANQLK